MIKKQWAMGVALAVVAVGTFVTFQIALAEATDLVEVPFAANDIYSHYEIKDEDIEWREVPSAYVDEDVITKKEDLLGMYVSLDSKIAKGSLFYASYLIEKEDVEALPALLLKEDQIAFPLSMNLLKSSGNTISKNQKVDVYVTYTYKVGNKKETVSDVLLENVRVIGLKDRNGLEMGAAKAANYPSVMVLAISKDYVNYLQSASEIASIDILAPRVDYGESEESLLKEDSKVLPFLPV